MEKDLRKFIKTKLNIPQPTLENFIENVAKKKLKNFQKILQKGVREGQSLFEHVINGIYILENIYKLIGITEEEKYVLMSAYSIHDLNKMPESEEKKLQELATKDNVKKILDKYNITSFLQEESEKYLEDITQLIRSHSGHQHHSGNLLIPKATKTYFSSQRIDKLISVIRALDISDLSDSFDEEKHKQDFISYINSVSDVQYKWIFHKITEQRGILTSMIHNCVSEIFQQKFKATPVLIYPEGTYYLVEQNFNFSEIEATQNDIAIKCNKRYQNLCGENVQKLIKGGNTGLKVTKEAFQSKEAEDIVDGLSSVINKKKAKNIEDSNKKILERATNLANKNKTASEFKNNIQEFMKKRNRKILFSKDGGIERILLLSEEEDVKKAELIKSYYNIISTFNEKDSTQTRWNKIISLLKDHIKFPMEDYNIFDNLDTAYLIAIDIDVDFENLAEIIKIGVSEFCNLSKELSADKPGFWLDYIKNILILNFSNSASPKDFLPYIKNYISNNFKQCCFDSGLTETVSAMSGDFPEGIKVQMFSNRLLGGSSRDPKRNICQICRANFMLEKVSFQYPKSGKISYIHLLPNRFISNSFWKAIESTTKKIFNSEELKTYIDFTDDGSELYTLSRKEKGLSYVNFPSNQGVDFSCMTRPFVNPSGGSDAEHYLETTLAGINLANFYQMKLIVSQNSFPIISSKDFGALYLDSIPSCFSGLFRRQNHSRETASCIAIILRNLYLCQNKLYTKNGHEFLKLAKSLSKGTLPLLSEVSHLVHRKVENEKLLNSTYESIFNYIDDTLIQMEKIEKEMPMDTQKLPSNHLQEMAKFASEGNLKGNCLNKNSLLMPLKTIFERIRRYHNIKDLELLKSDSIEEIFSFLERTRSSEYKPGDKAFKTIENFVNIFFTLLKENYNNNPIKILEHEKMLKNAFLYYIHKKISEKKVKNSNNNESSEKINE